MARIQIPVVVLEFDESGDTLWVHSPIGATVLRIKSMKGFVVDNACENAVAHADIIVEGPIHICVPEKSDLMDRIAEAVMHAIEDTLKEGS